MGLVNTDRCITTRTNPSGILALDKTPQSFGCDAPEILHHAHAVFHAITPIQMAELLARELRTVGAKISFVLPPRFAVSDFAGDACLRTFNGSTTRASIPLTQKSMAQSAIHAARCDKGRRSQTSSCGIFNHRSRHTTRQNQAGFKTQWSTSSAICEHASILYNWGGTKCGQSNLLDL